MNCASRRHRRAATGEQGGCKNYGNCEDLIDHHLVLGHAPDSRWIRSNLAALGQMAVRRAAPKRSPRANLDDGLDSSASPRSEPLSPRNLAISGHLLLVRPRYGLWAPVPGVAIWTQVAVNLNAMTGFFLIVHTHPFKNTTFEFGFAAVVIDKRREGTIHKGRTERGML